MEVSKVLEMSHFKGLIIGKRRLDKILDDIKKKKKISSIGNDSRMINLLRDTRMSLKAMKLYFTLTYLGG